MKKVSYKIDYDKTYKVTVLKPDDKDISIFMAHYLFYLELSEPERFKHILQEHGGKILENDKNEAKNFEVISIVPLEEKPKGMFKRF